MEIKRRVSSLGVTTYRKGDGGFWQLRKAEISVWVHIEKHNGLWYINYGQFGNKRCCLALPFKTAQAAATHAYFLEAIGADVDDYTNLLDAEKEST